jgi:class 3 adenylate cyclase
MSDRAGSRVSAVMVADVVGYHRLTETDEEATVAAMHMLRTTVLDPLLAKHDGTIVKLIEDEILALFGSAENAVRCAAAIQAGVKHRQTEVASDRRIILRIGIDVGEVVAQGEGVGGAGVALATRLKDVCEPGGVLISAAAQDQIPGTPHVLIDDAGTQRGENGEEPVHAYAVRLAKSLEYQPSTRRGVQPVMLAVLAAAVLAGGYVFYQARGPAEGDGAEARHMAEQEAPVTPDQGDETDPNIWGEIDGIGAGSNLSGWAVDMRDPSDQLTVYLYISGQDPTGALRGFSGCIETDGGVRNKLCGDFTFLGEVVADQPYTIPVDVPERVQRGSHGFSYSVPQQFQDGAVHYFYAYVILRGHEEQADALRGGENPDRSTTIYLYRSPRAATLNG